MYFVVLEFLIFKNVFCDINRGGGGEGIRYASRNYVDNTFVMKNKIIEDLNEDGEILNAVGTKLLVDNAVEKMQNLINTATSDAITINDVSNYLNSNKYIKEDVLGAYALENAGSENAVVRKKELDVVISDINNKGFINTADVNNLVDNAINKAVLNDDKTQKYALKSHTHDEYTTSDDVNTLIGVLENKFGDISNIVYDGINDEDRVMRKKDMNDIIEEGKSSENISISIDVYLANLGTTENIKLTINLNYPFPEYVYVKIEDVFNEVRKTHPEYTVNENFLYTSETKGFFKFSTIKNNEILLKYYESGFIITESVDFYYKNIGYFFHGGFTFKIEIKCSNDQNVTSISCFISTFYIGDYIYTFNDQVLIDCEGSNSYVKNDLGDNYVIPVLDSVNVIVDGFPQNQGLPRFRKKFDWTLFKFYVLNSHMGIGEYGNTGSAFPLFNGQPVDYIDFAALDFSRVTMMYWLFRNSKLTNIDLSNHKFNRVTSMYGMFSYCRFLKTVNLGLLESSEVTDMEQMFYDCYSLTSLDLSNFDTSKVETMHWMFYNCKSLVTLDIQNFIIKEGCDISEMFKGCDNLKNIIMKEETFNKLKNVLPGGGEKWKQQNLLSSASICYLYSRVE